MNRGQDRSNDYEPTSEPLEVFGYRRFESAQDFPHPPPSTLTKSQPSLNTYQPNGTEDWIDGFLENRGDLFGDVPGTFVGIETTLSPFERHQALEGSHIFGDGQDPFSLRASDMPLQLPKQIYSYSLNDIPHGNLQMQSLRTPIGNHPSLDSSFGIPPNVQDNISTVNQNGNYYFPTPPLSTHVPNFFDNTVDFGGRMPVSRIAQTPQRLQFGSDVRFEGPGFMAPPEQETEEALVRRKIDHLDCLKPEKSPASTHPPTPVLHKRRVQQLQYLNHYLDPPYQPQPPYQGTSQTLNDQKDPEPSPKRKRKAASEDDPDYADRSIPARVTPKRQRVVSSTDHTPERRDSATVPRGNSTPTGQSSNKNSRQCLSEEQKKTNHIISEQKRRDLIKRGYEGIQLMVPSLKGTKTSKGAMLESAANWLDDILECNEYLRQQLAEMKSRPERHAFL